MLAVIIRGVIVDQVLKLDWNKARMNIKNKEDCMVGAFVIVDIFLPLTVFDFRRP